MDEPNTNATRPAWLLPTPERREEARAGGPLRAFILRLMRGESLRRDEAASLLDALLDGAATDAQIGAALVALAVKGETTEELAGLASAMRARSVKIESRHRTFIDTAGTGSSAAKTFNVSTAAAFVIAGAGLPVAKHGSRAATSLSGSADVLAALGVNVSAAPEASARCLDEIGVCFMFAPLYHGATARVAGVRRELGVHTTFNLLGPLTNPAGAPRQLVGVWHAALVEPLARALAALGTERAWVVHGLDGLDEVTLAGPTSVAEVADNRVRLFDIAPQDFGLELSALDPLRGGDAEANARTIREVLDGRRRDAARALVVANAAAALHVGGRAADLASAARLAVESIDTGAALDKLEQLAEATNAWMTSHTYLDKIIEAKRRRLAEALSERSRDAVRAAALDARRESTQHSFRQALADKSRVNVIAEFKRASPSKGEINAAASASETARRYEAGGARALSVLTEQDFFRGSLADLREAKRASALPVLRKDFVFDAFQIYEAAEAGADAVLLIVAALTDDALRTLRVIIEEELGMDALVEVHDGEEMRRASDAGATLVGVNNRNLRTFDVSLDVSLKLAPLAPAGALLVSESGITGAADIELLRRDGYGAFLVGETLMRAGRPEDVLKELRGA